MPFRTIRPRAVRRLFTALLVGGVAALIGGCSGGERTKSVAVDPRPSLAPERVAEHVASFDMIWETVRDVHYDPNLNGADWEGLRVALRPRVEAARSDREARDAMMELLRGLGQSHFAVVPAAAYDVISGDEWREEKSAAGSTTEVAVGAPGDRDTHSASDSDATIDGAEAAAAHSSTTEETEPLEPLPPRNTSGVGQPGFDIAVADGRALVSRVVAGTSAEEEGVAMGWILHAVDGYQVSRTIDAVHSFSEGGEARMIMRSAILNTLAGDPGEQVDVTFLDAEDRERTLRLTLAPPKFVQPAFMNMPQSVVDWEFSRDGTIGLFRLSIFMHVMVRAQFAQFLEENPDLTGLVIDLRGNPGGIGFMANGLAGHLIDEAGLRLGTMESREQTIHFSIQPQVTVFEGKVAVLIDGGSASTSEILAAGLQDLGRARLFGANTAGAALPSMFVRLPNGDGFQYAIANYVSSGGEVLEGDGVAPDVAVSVDRAMLLEGIDPILHAANEWLRTP